MSLIELFQNLLVALLALTAAPYVFGQICTQYLYSIDKMSKLSGAEFDKEYVAAMVKAHKADDTLFAKEASSGTDPDLKAFADKTDKDVVKMHLQMIEDIQSKMK